MTIQQPDRQDQVATVNSFDIPQFSRQMVALVLLVGMGSMLTYESHGGGDVFHDNQEEEE